jgi:beta-glucosidase
MTDTTRDAGARHALEQLTLEEKVQLLTGRDFWNTWPLEKIGLRRILVSDGPSGVRGETWDERDPSLNLPSATALASAWDPDIARRYGAAAAVEARRKGVDVVLGPTINLHRSPLNGRHFECFSEDPVLTADLAAAYVRGVQDNGVGATPKHYIANDSETDRFNVDVQVADRPLRELYLLAFEKAITEAHAWLVMSSYNSVNGATATENDLLETPLNSEWGFDGVVISDWTAVRSLDSAHASQDLVMPGPDGPWGAALVKAVEAGDIEESVVDRKVLRILRLAQRVGALGDAGPAEPVHVEDGPEFVRAAAAEGMVLLENRSVDGAPTLPWDAAALRSVAVIGDNAANARTQGGGSATVLPAYTVSPLAGLRASLPDATVTYSVGAVSQTGLADLPLDQLTNPVTGTPGARVRFVDAAGVELFAEDRLKTAPLVWFGGAAPISESATVELSTRYTPVDSGTVRIGFAMVGRGQVWVDDELVIDEDLQAVGDDLGAAFLTPPSVTTPMVLTAGVPIDLRFQIDLGAHEDFLAGALSFQFGTEPDAEDHDALIAAAAEAAAQADVALVVVGTNSMVESEGFDRDTLALPGRQDDLVSAVAAANPRTVVLVNAGSPVLMPWRDEVAAVLVGYFGGQEFGDAVADVLLGSVEPGGRLPTTWGATDADVPVLSTTPVDGVLAYSEGIHIGYRAWLKHDVAPAYWFGHGLGYTDIAVTDVAAPTTASGGDAVAVSVSLANTGRRDGKQVVQVYAERAGSAVDRPVRWLVGYAPVRLAVGESTTVDVEVSTRLLAYWADGWTYEPGAYTLRVGTSVVALSHDVTLEVTA